MSAKRPIVRLRNASLALEPRLLYDGAALVDASLALDHSAESATKDSTNVDAPAVVKDLLTGLDVTSAQVQDAAEQAETVVKNFLATHTDEAIFEIFNGGQTSPDAEWQARLDTLRSDIEQGRFHIQVVDMEGASVNASVAAFVANGPNGEPAIALNAAWAQLLGDDVMSRVLTEEIGHALDYRLNGLRDTVGDEGALFTARAFADRLSADEVSSLRTENDHGQVTIGGQSYDAEFASFRFSSSVGGAYAVYPVPPELATEELDLVKKMDNAYF